MAVFYRSNKTNSGGSGWRGGDFESKRALSRVDIKRAVDFLKPTVYVVHAIAPFALKATVFITMLWFCLTISR